MTALFIDAIDPDPSVLDRAVDVLSRGGIVAYPTDTLYGLAVDPRDEQAVARLFAAKGRAPDAAIPLIAASLDQVRAVAAHVSDEGERLARRFWPGPLTLIFQVGAGLAAGIHAGGGTIAVRIPDHAIARALAGRFGFCLTSTSANRSGEPAPSTAQAVLAALADRVDLVLDGGATPGGAASTIVDLSGGSPRLVRAGVVPWARVLESLP